MHLAKQKQSTLQSYIGLYTGLICCSLYSPSMHPACGNITSFHTKLVISLLVWVSDIYNYLFVLVRLRFGVKWGDVSTCHVHARWKYSCRHIFQEKECFIVSHSRQFENRGRLTHPLCKLSIQLDSQELCWFLKKTWHKPTWTLSANNYSPKTFPNIAVDIMPFQGIICLLKALSGTSWLNCTIILTPHTE